MTEDIVHFGVGIDTGRYGHYVSFLREDRRPATRGFTFAETRAGYDQLQTALQKLAERHGGQVEFHIRLDVAGQYAANLEAFLRQLPYAKSISVGEPKRNQDYRNAHFPKRKADPVDSLACARFAIVERPHETPATPVEFLSLRNFASAVQSQRRQTRWHRNSTCRRDSLRDGKDRCGPHRGRSPTNSGHRSSHFTSNP